MKLFPVLWQGDKGYIQTLRDLGCPRDVPWDFVADHRERCLKNHGQTPERLAERGGLAPCEMVAVILERRWTNMEPAKSVEQLKVLLLGYSSQVVPE